MRTERQTKFIDLVKSSITIDNYPLVSQSELWRYSRVDISKSHEFRLAVLIDSITEFIDDHLDLGDGKRAIPKDSLTTFLRYEFKGGPKLLITKDEYIDGIEYNAEMYNSRMRGLVDKLIDCLHESDYALVY